MGGYRNFEKGGLRISDKEGPTMAGGNVAKNFEN